MRANILLAVVVAAALALLLVSLFRPAPQSNLQKPAPDTLAEASHPTPNTQAETQRAPRSPQPQRQSTPDAPANWALEPLPPGRNLQEQLQELARRKGVPLNVLTQQALAQWSNMLQETSRQMNSTMDFYGKAVDEKGLPLAAARAEFGCHGVPEEYFATNVLSDVNGLFALNNVTGRVIFVRVSKPGYLEVPGTNQNRFSYDALLGPSAFQADSNNPVVFRLKNVEVQRN